MDGNITSGVEWRCEGILSIHLFWDCRNLQFREGEIGTRREERNNEGEYYEDSDLITHCTRFTASP